MPRILISDDGVTRRYRVTNAGGQEIGFDEEHIPTVEESIAETLRSRARTALDANATYLNIASPSNAQVVAQVRRLTQECSGMIRLVLGVLDTTDGT